MEMEAALWVGGRAIQLRERLIWEKFHIAPSSVQRPELDVSLIRIHSPSVSSQQSRR
jgi:hypothetical protein